MIPAGNAHCTHSKGMAPTLRFERSVPQAKACNPSLCPHSASPYSPCFALALVCVSLLPSFCESSHSASKASPRHMRGVAHTSRSMCGYVKNVNICKMYNLKCMKPHTESGYSTTPFLEWGHSNEPH